MASCHCSDVAYEFVETQIGGKLVERPATHNLAAQVGEEPLLLVPIVAVEDVCHDGS